MSLFGKTETEQLTTRHYILANEHRYRGWLILLVVLTAIGASAYAGVHYFEEKYATMQRVVELEQENADLRKSLDETQANLEETQLKLELESATQAGFEKQVRELSAEVTQLKEQLNFFRKAKEKP